MEWSGTAHSGVCDNVPQKHMTASRQTAARLTAERRAGEGSQAFWTLIKTLAFLLSRRRGVRGRYHCWIAGLCFTKLMVACSISTCHDSLLAVPLCAMELSAQCRCLTTEMLSKHVSHGQRTISRLGSVQHHSSHISSHQAHNLKRIHYINKVQGTITADYTYAFSK